MQTRRLRLVHISGDAQLADLLSCEGELCSVQGHLTFFPDNRTDWLTMRGAKESVQGKKTIIETRAGNTFIFYPPED